VRAGILLSPPWRGFPYSVAQESRNPRASLGGHVEYGEYALETVHREFREEIGQALTGVKLGGVLENIFEWAGATQHEIVFIFTADLADEAAYEIPEQAIRDAPGKTRVIWRPPNIASPPLYPAGVADIAAGAVTA
jgi:ADP-ribose pyrophosphatase YjhB (NUDIX family)